MIVALMLAAAVAGLAALKLAADGDHHPITSLRRWRHR